MNKKGQDWIIILFTFMIISFIIITIFIIIGLQIKISENGIHTGYVTAIETNGWLFKTDSVYFKTDTESTQEDRYCIKDKELKDILQEHSQNGTKITITYYDVMFYGIKNCKSGDIAIIDGIK